MTSTVSGYLTSFLEEGLIGILLNSLGQRVYTGLLRPLVYFSCGYGANMSIFMDILSKSCPALLVFSRTATDRGGPSDPCLPFPGHTFTLQVTVGYKSPFGHLLVGVSPFDHAVLLTCLLTAFSLFGCMRDIVFVSVYPRGCDVTVA